MSSFSKDLINSPDTIVPDAVEGLLLANPHLARVGKFNVVVRRDIESIKNNQVTIISGGGSGHENAHAGFIDTTHGAMLAGSVLGGVFASPSVNAILAAIRVCCGTKGLLVIVKNYTGDALNFGLAIEKAKQEGMVAAMVVVDDDAALPPGKGITGGRGLAGTVLVHKIAGALATLHQRQAQQEPLSVDEICKYLKSHIIPNIRTIGVALSTCHIPGSKQASSTRLDGNVFEVGLGIHGEPGREQLAFPTANAAATVSEILVNSLFKISSSDEQPVKVRKLNDDLDQSTPPEHHQLLTVQSTNRLVLLVNNLGGISILEMQIMMKEILLLCKTKQLQPVRVYSGHFVTSLRMAGLSLSALLLPTSVADEILDHLDTTTSAPAWSQAPAIDLRTSLAEQTIAYDENEFDDTFGHKNKSQKNQKALPCHHAISILKDVCEVLINAEATLTAYDQICGDGDCGVTVTAGAHQILKDIVNCVDVSAKAAFENDAALLCHQIANTVSNSMGGTFGVLMEICFRAMSAEIVELTNNGSVLNEQLVWIQALAAGVKAIQRYGRATLGMRTLLDALLPAITTLQQTTSVQLAAQAAESGVEKTKSMAALAGRANYIQEKQMHGVPDPGAVVVSLVFQVLSQHLTATNK